MDPWKHFRQFTHQHHIQTEPVEKLHNTRTIHRAYEKHKK